MERAGLRLKHTRERMKLTFRDVEKASQQIAARHNNDEFAIALSRLADIENKGTLPNLYRLFSLCAIYRLEFREVLEWYGIPKEEITEAFQIGLESTHPVHFSRSRAKGISAPGNTGIDPDQTTYLSGLIRRWGKLPAFLEGIDRKQHRYGYIGLQDWSMYPLLHPGSLVLIDEGKRKIVSEGWSNEFERPIYFLERRDGYECGWCTRIADRLLVQPHPASPVQAHVYAYPGDVDVVGQVVGVAMLLGRRNRQSDSASVRSASRDR